MESIRTAVRSVMRRIARGLHAVSRGRITPNMVSYTSLLGHVGVLWSLSTHRLGLAVVFIIVFGLMDALDGELARLQKTANAGGMLMDASFDRIKEALIYIGLTQYFIVTGNFLGIRLSIVTLAGSMLVSYVKAKGETALTDGKMTANEKNRALQDGFARYEVRMAILIIAILSHNYLNQGLALIAVLVWLTAVSRFLKIYDRLHR